MENINQRIEALCKEADRLSAIGNPKNPRIHTAMYGGAWCRILATPTVGPGATAYGFVALKDSNTKALGEVKAGDIHRAASYKVAAKTKRGSVFSPDFDLCLCEYSVAYIGIGNSGVTQRTHPTT
jgi:hypothetical protein